MGKFARRRARALSAQWENLRRDAEPTVTRETFDGSAAIPWLAVRAPCRRPSVTPLTGKPRPKIASEPASARMGSMAQWGAGARATARLQWPMDERSRPMGHDLVLALLLAALGIVVGVLRRLNRWEWD